MRDHSLFYIAGQWVPPVHGGEPFDVVNPATEAVAGVIRLGDEADVERAAAAARQAFDGWSTSSLKTRTDLLARIAGIYERRIDEMAAAISVEMGAPLAKVARAAQAPLGLWQVQTALALAADYPFEKRQGKTHIVKEAVGVCALITPWNWPMNQVLCKVAPALLAGCTMVLKPSEFAPFSAQILAEILHEAEVPPGVFNLIHGDGAHIGPLLSAHREVNMVSLTGSTRAGSSVARHAADTIKVVSLELGGKSANIILDDAPLEEAVAAGVMNMMFNTGQSCNAPSRMLVPAAKLADAQRVAAAAVQRLIVGDPMDNATTTGPIANRRQYERVQSLIARGIEEGATLVAGGLGRPEGIASGWFARPTIFGGVSNRMTIAREEIFGPVLVMIPYSDEDDAVAIANDSDYGLSGYVWGGTVARAAAIAKRLRTGMVHLNGAGVDLAAPFGGYKMSGNGREWGTAGIDEFLETKALMGAGA
jgi:aldehyde dehydrogenase (NAD+)